MDVGIVSFGAYIPIYRMKRKLIGEIWGGGAGRGEKAIANWDEDSLTMGVEACVDSLGDTVRDAIDGLIFASTTSPYREKQSASLIRKVLDLKKDAFTADVSNSLRGGTIGLKMAMNAVKAGSGKSFLVAISDLRIPAPNSASEMEFGDGAAALLIGSEDLVATINCHYSVTSEFTDSWRKDKDAYVQTWEDRFVLTEGYQNLMVESLKKFFSKCQSNPESYAKAAIYSPNPRALQTVSQKVGLDYKKQVSTQLYENVGNTGTPFAFMMLVEVLEKSRPGDRILLATYGDGVDLFDLTVTEKIANLPKPRGIERHLSSSMPLEKYGRYLRFRDLMEWQFDRRPPDRTSLPVIQRERNQIYSLHGHQCRNCGTIQYPMQRVCTRCQTKDRFDEVRLSDRKGSIFTFSMDERAMVPDLPNVLSIVDLEGGGRYYSVMTDRDPSTIKIGMPIEMTFRKIHEGLMLYNYFWKTRPVRG